MNLRQLEVFRIIVLYESVTLASVSLNISKPTTLRLIANLERSLGFKLFYRVNDHLHLTAEGRLFVSARSGTHGTNMAAWQRSRQYGGWSKRCYAVKP
jgi:DNA-binding transcriptional LysR family regulator